MSDLSDKRQANYQNNQTRNKQTVRVIRQERSKVSDLSDKRQTHCLIKQNQRRQIQQQIVENLDVIQVQIRHNK
jgi:hypothetical protein